MDNIYTDLVNNFPDLNIKKDFPLAPLTTLKIGGPADIFIQTQTNLQLVNLLKFLSKYRKEGKANNFSAHSDGKRSEPEGSEHCKNLFANLPITILGNGSNVLISDSGIRGIVIKNASQEIEFIKPNLIKASSGVVLSTLINFSFQHGLVGLETFAYIPASTGGAIHSNIHGFDKSNFNQYLKSIDIFDLNSQQLHTLLASKLKWFYDYSQFQNSPNQIIISALLSLKIGDVPQAKQTYQDIIANKSLTQSLNSAGSVFQNPDEATAKKIWGKPKSTGWIIDQELGLKGTKIGGAQISPLHANFIINTSKVNPATAGATAKDFLALVDLIKSHCQEKFNWQPKLEITLLGDFKE